MSGSSTPISSRSSTYAAYEPQRPGGPPRRLAIRSASNGDVPACTELSRSYSGGDAGRVAARLHAQLDDPRHHLLVAEADGDVLGYGRVSRFDPPADAARDCAPAGWYLMGVVVDQRARRAGIGRALTRARIELVAERADELWYFANAHNRASIDLHERHGFVEVTRSFSYPGVDFADGVGILFRLELARQIGARPVA